MQRADAVQSAHLRAGLGDPHLGAAAIESLRSIIVATGALAEVESVIGRRTEEAITALDAAGLAPDVRTNLNDLAIAATARSM